MWPFAKRETRQATGGYTNIISQLIGAQAAGTTQQASATAALGECRWDAIENPGERGGTGHARDCPGGHAAMPGPNRPRSCRALAKALHVIRHVNGRMILIPASTWYWEGGADPASWLCTATAYGPSGSSTWRVPMESVVFVAWGSPTARPYHGLGPTAWAAETARLSANAERALADEAGGPVAQLLPVPQDGGDDGDSDPLEPNSSQISARRRATPF